MPGVDTTVVSAQVWQDGPPWFSCAEVLSKLGGRADAAAVRDQVGAWRPLVLAGWIVLRDTAQGPVSEPGWCVAKLTQEAARHAQGWRPLEGDSFPTGSRRRGWTVPLGTRRLAVSATPRGAGRDTATVDYVSTIKVNANGAALRADTDTFHAVALLRRIDGRWRLLSARPWGSTPKHPVR